MIRLMMLLMMLLPFGTLADDRMGRLFLTPAERTNLDYLRKNSKPPEKILPSDAQEGVTVLSDAPQAPPAIVSIQGYVKRSDGKGTVWVNRQPVQERTSTSEFSVGKLGAKDNRVEVKLPGSSKPVSLKAGQYYDSASGMIVDDRRRLPEVDGTLPTQDKTVSAASSTESQNKP